MKVLCIFGTRPEAIKMAPVVKELERHSERLEQVVCVTAQHRQMLDQVLRHFQICPQIDLALMREDQDLVTLTARALTELSTVLVQEKPNLALVQGDTTTALAGALAAFYQKVPVGHVEAGLRTGNPYSPYPEEINRRLISVLATYHFAPTATAASALHAEGVPDDRVFVTGNTVVDALLWTAGCEPSTEARHLLESLGMNNRSPRQLLLVTAHRRENFGRPLENICEALLEVARRNPEVSIVYPVHMNPNVRGPVYQLLANQDRILLTDPLPYEPFVHLMARCHLILTDSGGIQEEAPALGKPVLVMRRETERPEAVEAGTAKVVGTDTASIVAATESLLHNAAEYQRMAQAVSPYGDGHAAERIVATILEQCQ